MECLTEEMLRAALRTDDLPPSCEPCVVLHPDTWEDFKRIFNKTDAQMEKWFVKSAEYIK